MNLKRLDICLFGYGGVNPNTVQALIGEVFHGIVKEHVQVNMGFIADDALISRSRSRALSAFLKRPDAQVLLMVDHDLSWNPGDGIATARKAWECSGIVGGMYAKAGGGHASSPAAEIQELVVGGEKTYPAEYVATGFMAISRGAAEKLLRELDRADAPPDLRIQGRCSFNDEEFWDFFRCFTEPDPRIQSKNNYLSEDFAMSRRSAYCSIPLLIYEKPRLIHYKTIGLRVEDG